MSLDEDEHDGKNSMSLDESYSGNVSGLHVLNHDDNDNNMFDCAQIGGDDDNEDMDVDDSYAERGSHVGLDLCRLF